MTMNFPSPATPGQIYAPPGGPVYRFDDPVWTAVTGGPSSGDIGGALVTATGGSESNTLADWFAGLGKAEAPPIKGFWTDNGPAPNIWRFRDRVFFGQAAGYAGEWGVDPGSSWLNSSPLALEWVERGTAILAVQEQGSANMVLAVAGRTSDGGSIPGYPATKAFGTIGVTSIAYADDTVREEFGSTQKTKAWAYYGEAIRVAGAGLIQFMEGDVCNFDPADTSRVTPYAFTGAPSSGIWMASGGGKAGVYDATAAYVVSANGAKWNKGLVMRSTALTIDGSGSMSAIDLPKQAMIQWHHNTVETSFNYITSNHSGTDRTGITLGDAAINFGMNADVPMYMALGASPALQIRKSASGQQASILGLTGTSTRWALTLGNATAEGGANAGSNLTVSRYDDAGTFIDLPFSINRASGKTTLVAGGTAGASINLPHGAAPTTPVNGDIWTTTAGLFVRINGVTKTVTLT